MFNRTEENIQAIIDAASNEGKVEMVIFWQAELDKIREEKKVDA